MDLVAEFHNARKFHALSVAAMAGLVEVGIPGRVLSWLCYALALGLLARANGEFKYGRPVLRQALEPSVASSLRLDRAKVTPGILRTRGRDSGALSVAVVFRGTVTFRRSCRSTYCKRRLLARVQSSTLQQSSVPGRGNPFRQAAERDEEMLEAAPGMNPEFGVRSVIAPVSFVAKWDRECYHHIHPVAEIEWLELRAGSTEWLVSILENQQIPYSLEGGLPRVWRYIRPNSQLRWE